MDAGGRPSRRDFLKLTSTGLALAGTGSCRWPDEPADERSDIQVLRADDLLSLRFRFHNLRIVHRRGRPPNLVRIRDDEAARVVVELPGQHRLHGAQHSGSSRRDRGGACRGRRRSCARLRVARWP